MPALTRVFTCLILLCHLSLAQAASEVIQLNFRLAQEVLPAAQSILGSEGRVSAYGQQLIVNAPASKIDELRAIIAQIDTQPRRLLITVDTQGNQANTQRGYSMDGSFGGRHGEVVIGQGQAQGTNRARIIRNTTESRDGSIYTLQTLEGSAARVQVGQRIPQHTSHRGRYGQNHEERHYQSVDQGFYVTATVLGDNVQIEINNQNDRRSPHNSAVIETQSTSSRLTGRLGQWINVSTQQQDNNYQKDALTQKRYATARENNSLQIKVEVLD